MLDLTIHSIVSAQRYGHRVHVQWTCYLHRCHRAGNREELALLDHAERHPVGELWGDLDREVWLCLNCEHCPTSHTEINRGAFIGSEPSCVMVKVPVRLPAGWRGSGEEGVSEAE